ncbi:hypothetical protein [Longimicrobium sp.]|uniref:hypothetical protein n=1 Tax=Longimicrobium sp. TaxID=2029185 RepID=UPI002B990EA0|nr:hypothetical protein [Longimicrobium sp.]HSU15422.1 hypothetical protein [Longimicrobium sp.]
MKMRVSAAARLLAAVALLVSWTTAGWAAACARPSAPGAGMHAMGMHHAMHHQPAPPGPERHRAPRGGETPECPLLAMNGGSCLGAAHLPAIVSAPASALAPDAGYPPADGVRDRLIAISVFHPPRT